MKNHLAKAAFVIFAAAGTVVFAQTQNPAPRQYHQVDPQKQLNHLTKKLALTQDQQNQILPILTDRQHQAEDIRADTSLSEKDRREKMKTLRNDSESQLRAVLTDTQRAAYDQMRQEARERAQNRKQTTVQQ